MQRLMQASFWGALVFTFVSAVLPEAYAPSLNLWDKAAHCICFFVLTLLGALAYPWRRLLVIAAGLALLGALIEVVQGLPIVRRDMDFWDWVADVLGIAIACAALGLFRLPKSRRVTEAG